MPDHQEAAAQDFLEPHLRQGVGMAVSIFEHGPDLKSSRHLKYLQVILDPARLQISG